MRKLQARRGEEITFRSYPVDTGYERLLLRTDLRQSNPRLQSTWHDSLDSCINSGKVFSIENTTNSIIWEMPHMQRVRNINREPLKQVQPRHSVQHSGSEWTPED